MQTRTSLELSHPSTLRRDAWNVQDSNGDSIFRAQSPISPRPNGDNETDEMRRRRGDNETDGYEEEEG
jgi:hypothetical protein